MINRLSFLHFELERALGILVELSRDFVHANLRDVRDGESRLIQLLTGLSLDRLNQVNRRDRAEDLAIFPDGLLHHKLANRCESASQLLVDIWWLSTT